MQHLRDYHAGYKSGLHYSTLNNYWKFESLRKCKLGCDSDAPRVRAYWEGWRNGMKDSKANAK